MIDSFTLPALDVEDAVRPFIGHFDTWHASTAPRFWLESLVKAYVGDGLAADLYREMAGWLDEQTQALVLEMLADTGHTAFADLLTLHSPEVRDSRLGIRKWLRPRSSRRELLDTTSTTSKTASPRIGRVVKVAR